MYRATHTLCSTSETFGQSLLAQAGRDQGCCTGHEPQCADQKDPSRPDHQLKSSAGTGGRTSPTGSGERTQRQRNRHCDSRIDHRFDECGATNLASCRTGRSERCLLPVPAAPDSKEVADAGEDGLVQHPGQTRESPERHFPRHRSTLVRVQRSRRRAATSPRSAEIPPQWSPKVGSAHTRVPERFPGIVLRGREELPGVPRARPPRAPRSTPQGPGRTTASRSTRATVAATKALISGCTSGSETTTPRTSESPAARSVRVLLTVHRSRSPVPRRSYLRSRGTRQRRLRHSPSGDELRWALQKGQRCGCALHRFPLPISVDAVCSPAQNDAAIDTARLDSPASSTIAFPSTSDPFLQTPGSDSGGPDNTLNLTPTPGEPSVAETAARRPGSGNPAILQHPPNKRTSVPRN